jgi:pimeloyl-ACP methyl ester carboxylesterase
VGSYEPKRVRVGDIDIEYAEAGRGERALVLVHGFTGGRDDFLEQMEPLGRHGRTIALDQRGHGGSSNPGDPSAYSLDILVADFAGFVETLGLERIDLLGHSMGGMLALRYALSSPARVASLILMDTAPAPISFLPEAIFERTVALAREHGTGFLLGGMRRQAEEGGRQLPAAKRCAEAMGVERFWSRIQAKLDAMDPEAYATLGPELATQKGVTDRLHEIPCPTTIIVGEEDAPFHGPADELERGIAGARRFTIAGARHSPRLEATPEFQRIVVDHLARARAGA